jgi:hypothetical protein
MLRYAPKFVDMMISYRCIFIVSGTIQVHIIDVYRYSSGIMDSYTNQM